MFGAETSGLPKEVSCCISKQCIVVFHTAQAKLTENAL